ncbi:MAG TPA: 16S rRNA (uracil(1498)-N(3))-methyltransferase [Alphaproteobacteria bacterium]|nr:16S rRNA (uracil(1498)-N(3))-methyltransferase [Alphaproteobacteria bacterium]
MSEERARIRLFVDQALAPGVAVGLGAEQAHYLRSVMRLSAGAPLLLFNGRDGEWRARLDGLGKGWASCAVESRTRIQDRGPDLWLVFAPIKRARIDFVAEKATELGVSGLWPVFTRWTAVGRVNVERLRANAIEAAEQCGRLSVPEIFPAATLDEMLARWPAERRVLLCDETGTAASITAALAGSDAAFGPWAVMTGPEGGFSADELDRLKKLPIVTAASLGPRVLRADTAALAALACWQALAGDWRGACHKTSDEIIPPTR